MTWQDRQREIGRWQQDYDFCMEKLAEIDAEQPTTDLERGRREQRLTEWKGEAEKFQQRIVRLQEVRCG